MKNIMSEDIIHECTGCGMCAAVCPVNAIAMTQSDEGFYVPQINTEVCVSCGKCIQACYKYDNNYNFGTHAENKKIMCYGAKNKTEEELMSSSSGAVSAELMRWCIENGYKVAGVAYDEKKDRAFTSIASTSEESERFKGSKYFQSHTVDAFRKIVKDKSEQKYAIFGTPCQIYAFSELAKITNERNKYLLVDIFCHGCPSLILWDRYLSFKKKEYETTDFDKINFRSKTSGWHEFCFDFFYKGRKRTSSEFDDPFFELFFSNDFLNRACYDCVARGSVEKPDIRIGDFWGDRYDSDTTGVSAVVICSEKGRVAWSGVKSKFITEEVPFEEITAFQSYDKTYDVPEKRRSESLKIIKTEKNILRAIKEHRRLMPNKQRIKMHVKRVLKHLPKGLYNGIRSFFHGLKRQVFERG